MLGLFRNKNSNFSKKAFTNGFKHKVLYMIKIVENISKNKKNKIIK